MPVRNHGSGREAHNNGAPRRSLEVSGTAESRVMTDVRNRQELSLLDRLGRLLQEMLDSTRQQPIPERWTDLLNRLNAEEPRGSSSSALAHDKPGHYQRRLNIEVTKGLASRRRRSNHRADERPIGRRLRYVQSVLASACSFAIPVIDEERNASLF